MSRASLVDAYISGLNLTAVAIVGAGRRCRIITGEPAPGETIQHQYYFKPSHAELVLATIGLEGVTDQKPAAVAALVEQTTAMLGASYQTPAELRRAAELAVAEIVARVRLASQGGSLRQVNAGYKRYRLAQAAKGEKAIPYSAYLATFTASIVKQAAASGRAI